MNSRRALHESQVYKDFTAADQAVKDMAEYVQRTEVMVQIKDLKKSDALNTEVDE